MTPKRTEKRNFTVSYELQIKRMFNVHFDTIQLAKNKIENIDELKDFGIFELDLNDGTNSFDTKRYHQVDIFYDYDREQYSLIVYSRDEDGYDFLDTSYITKGLIEIEEENQTINDFDELF